MAVAEKELIQRGEQLKRDGIVIRTYDLWNPERGASQRAILIIDKEGIIRYRRVYTVPHLPDTEEIVHILRQLAVSSPTGEGQRG